MNVGIIGFGLMGQQRARSLAQLPGHRLVEVFDPNQERAWEAASKFEAPLARSWKAMLHKDMIEGVIVAVPHFETREIVIAALRAGKHVFSEKPLGRTTQECEEILNANSKGIRLGVGFNYRYYPAIQQAKEMLDAGVLGKLTHIRCVMGHGGRPGYEREWKTSKQLCGGGALLDPGIHLVDLVRFLAGEIVEGSASLFNSFWNIDVEDNAFVDLKLEGGGHALLHISITEWKSRFSLDLFGTEGAISIEGRSGFYGAQSLRFHRRWSWVDHHEDLVIEYPQGDDSFRQELAEYFAALGGTTPRYLATANDALRAIDCIDSLYARQYQHADSVSATH
jgi:predicted dehydrogenase